MNGFIFACEVQSEANDIYSSQLTSPLTPLVKSSQSTIIEDSEESSLQLISENEYNAVYDKNG